jgi:hypothetical protein
VLQQTCLCIRHTFVEGHSYGKLFVRNSRNLARTAYSVDNERRFYLVSGTRGALGELFLYSLYAY